MRAGWNNEIKSITTDYCFEDKKGWHVGITVLMRVTLVDGSFHEDVGWGAAANAKARGDALMQAKKVRASVQAAGAPRPPAWLLTSVRWVFVSAPRDSQRLRTR